MKDGLRSSRRSMPPKDYIISGNNVFERTNKRPEDVLNDLLYEDEEEQQVRNVSNHCIITREKLGRCIKAVQKHFWGSSSYTVVFCVYRDKFDYKNNMSRFEEEVQVLIEELHLDYSCPKNTISNTVYHNKFMRYSIDKWEECQASKRSKRLVEHILNAMDAM